MTVDKVIAKIIWLTFLAHPVVYIYHSWPYIWTFGRSSHSNRQKLQSSTTPLSFEAPANRGTPANVRTHLVFPETSHQRDRLRKRILMKGGHFEHLMQTVGLFW